MEYLFFIQYTFIIMNMDFFFNHRAFTHMGNHRQVSSSAAGHFYAAAGRPLAGAKLAHRTS